MTLVATMTHRAIKGDESLPSAVSGEVVATEKEMTREQKFQIGWSHYKEQLADMLVEDRYEPKINLKREIRDLARLYGSSNSPANGDLKSLKLFMHLLCQDQCEADVRKHGVKIVRSVLYMNPDTIKSTSKQDDEYERYFANKDPSTAGQDDFRAFQVKVAQGGGVQVVVACMSSKDPETQLGALQLGCTLLASGNSAVQDLFYKQLSSAQSQSFFSALKAIFDSAVENIKETKRKAKQVPQARTRARARTHAHACANMYDHSCELGVVIGFPRTGLGYYARSGTSIPYQESLRVWTFFFTLLAACACAPLTRLLSLLALYTLFSVLGSFQRMEEVPSLTEHVMWWKALCRYASAHTQSPVWICIRTHTTAYAMRDHFNVCLSICLHMPRVSFLLIRAVVHTFKYGRVHLSSVRQKQSETGAVRHLSAAGAWDACPAQRC